MASLAVTPPRRRRTSQTALLARVGGAVLLVAVGIGVQGCGGEQRPSDPVPGGWVASQAVAWERGLALGDVPGLKVRARATDDAHAERHLSSSEAPAVAKLPASASPVVVVAPTPAPAGLRARRSGAAGPDCPPGEVLRAVAGDAEVAVRSPALAEDAKLLQADAEEDTSEDSADEETPRDSAQDGEDTESSEDLAEPAAAEASEDAEPAEAWAAAEAEDVGRLLADAPIDEGMEDRAGAVAATADELVVARPDGAEAPGDAEDRWIGPAGLWTAAPAGARVGGDTASRLAAADRAADAAMRWAKRPAGARDPAAKSQRRRLISSGRSSASSVAPQLSQDVDAQTVASPVSILLGAGAGSMAPSADVGSWYTSLQDELQHQNEQSGKLWLLGNKARGARKRHLERAVDPGDVREGVQKLVRLRARAKDLGAAKDWLAKHRLSSRALRDEVGAAWQTLRSRGFSSEELRRHGLAPAKKEPQSFASSRRGDHREVYMDGRARVHA